MSGYEYTKAYSAYGASMGRRDQKPVEHARAWKIRIERMRAVDSDYDAGGAYWGSVRGSDSVEPMWVCWSWYEDGYGLDYLEHFIRAANRDHAKSQMRALYPGCKFYR